MKQKKSGLLRRTTAADVLIFAFFVMISFSMLIPFWNTLVTSLSPESENMEPTFRLFPKTISFDGYKGILSQDKLIRSFFINVFITITGTFLHVSLTCMAGYALSQGRFRGKQTIMNLVLISMVLPGQVMMIPLFILYRDLNLLDNILVMVVSGMVSAYSILLFRNFFLSIPKAVHEAAVMDGAGEFKILFRIYLPMSKAGIATVTLFQMVARWNTFFEGVLYINSSSKQPLQVVLNEIVATFANNNPSASAAVGGSMLGKNIQSASVILSMLPLLIIYPILQRYFIRGIFLGSVKE